MIEIYKSRQVRKLYISLLFTFAWLKYVVKHTFLPVGKKKRSWNWYFHFSNSSKQVPICCLLNSPQWFLTLWSHNPSFSFLHGWSLMSLLHPENKAITWHQSIRQKCQSTQWSSSMGYWNLTFPLKWPKRKAWHFYHLVQLNGVSSFSGNSKIHVQLWKIHVKALTSKGVWISHILLVSKVIVF